MERLLFAACRRSKPQCRLLGSQYVGRRGCETVVTSIRKNIHLNSSTNAFLLYSADNHQQLGNQATGQNTSSLPLTVHAGDLHFTKITPASNPFTCALSDAGSLP
jgi:hypothetical protein